VRNRKGSAAGKSPRDPSLALFVTEAANVEEDVHFDLIHIGAVHKDVEIRRIHFEALTLGRGEAFRLDEVLLSRRHRHGGEAHAEHQNDGSQN